MKQQTFIVRVFRDGREERLIPQEIKDSINRYMEKHIPEPFRPKVITIEEVES